MKCPFCSEPNTQVIDTRENEEGDTVRRRRRCLACDKRFTTDERVELRMPLIVKKNGSRADYDRDKLLASLMLALRKRPVTTESIDAAIEAMLAETRRLEEITRGASVLRVSAAYDGLEIGL